ncbi:MAG: hypothetical protein SGJ10_03255 [Bacteroidota bacterium]|nr:hypothetical protein [Bacteroidota bacterium]
MSVIRLVLYILFYITCNPNEGWLDIIQNSQVIDKKSSLFKIPHHGSKNGFHEDIWLNLLTEKPISKLTPWNRNSKLPESEMLIRYSDLSMNLLMASPLVSDKPKKREKRVEKIIDSLNKKLREVKYKKGIISCRVKIDEIDSNWEVSLFENAFSVSEELNKL